MKDRDYHCYDYDSNAATINLEEITSSAENAKILQRLRDGDPTLIQLYLGTKGRNKFYAGEGDDMGWLGYFIGTSQCLQSLFIRYLPDGEEGHAHAFAEGIARSQSICYISIDHLNDDGFTSIVRALGSLSQLVGLTIWGDNNVGPDSWYELRTLLESGVCKKLIQLCLYLHSSNYIGNEGVDVLSNGLRGIGSSLKILRLNSNSVGNEGLLAVVEALANCTGLRTLDLSRNDFSLAAAGLASLSDWLRRDEVNLKYLNLSSCRINDEGLLAFNEGSSSFSLEEPLQTCTSLETLNLSWNEFSSAAGGLRSLSGWLQSDEVNLKRLSFGSCSIDDEGLRALSQGAANHCEELYLGGNESITTTGLSYLSNSIRSDSCRVETLHIHVGDNGMKVLARGLAGNKSVRSVYLEELDDDISITSAGWVAFSTALCDTSSVNSTYLSNHTLEDIRAKVDGDINLPQDISLYLQLNKQHPQHAARCKILTSHPHLDMTPFLQWKMKLLPMAVAWFERAKPCTTLTIREANSASRRRVLDESNDAFQSRALSAMYEFVRGMPEEVMKSRNELILMAYDDEIAMAEEEIKRLVNKRKGLLKDKDSFLKDVEQRDEELVKLKEENKRLSKIVVCITFAVFLSLYLLS